MSDFYRDNIKPITMEITKSPLVIKKDSSKDLDFIAVLNFPSNPDIKAVYLIYDIPNDQGLLPESVPDISDIEILDIGEYFSEKKERHFFRNSINLFSNIEEEQNTPYGKFYKKFGNLQIDVNVVKTLGPVYLNGVQQFCRVAFYDNFADRWTFIGFEKIPLTLVERKPISEIYGPGISITDLVAKLGLTEDVEVKCATAKETDIFNISYLYSPVPVRDICLLLGEEEHIILYVNNESIIE